MLKASPLIQSLGQRNYFICCKQPAFIAQEQGMGVGAVSVLCTCVCMLVAYSSATKSEGWGWEANQGIHSVQAE